MKPVNGKSAAQGLEVAVSLLKAMDPKSIGSIIGLGADIVMLVEQDGRLLAPIGRTRKSEAMVSTRRSASGCMIS